MKRKRLMVFGVGILAVSFVVGAGVYAQTMGEVGAATTAGTTLGAAGGSGMMSPSKYAEPATDAAARSQQLGEGGTGGGER